VDARPACVRPSSTGGAGGAAGADTSRRSRSAVAAHSSASGLPLAKERSAGYVFEELQTMVPPTWRPLVDDLREIALGIHPATLAEGGYETPPGYGPAPLWGPLTVLGAVLLITGRTRFRLLFRTLIRGRNERGRSGPQWRFPGG